MKTKPGQTEGVKDLKDRLQLQLSNSQLPVSCSGSYGLSEENEWFGLSPNNYWGSVNLHSEQPTQKLSKNKFRVALVVLYDLRWACELTTRVSL